MVKRGGPPAEAITSPSPVGGRSRRHRAWVAATVLLIAGGVAASALSADAVRRNDADESLKSFQRSSASVASTLQLALEHENDVVVDAGGLLSDPGLSQTAFRRWVVATRLLQRYPEMAGVAVIMVVDAADLPAFGARSVADPAGRLPADRTFAVVPAGARPFYCLISAAVARVPAGGAAMPLAGTDYCADPRSGPLLVARDSGRGAYLPYSAGGKAWLTVETPIFRGGLTPTTVGERRAAFAGAVGIQLDPSVVLVRALRDEPGLSVSMRYRVGSADVAFTSGHPPDGARSVTTDLHNGWTVQTSALVRSGRLTSSNVLVALIGGIVTSVLLALLAYVLGTGRERARRQLQERTRELHHQALHDALTGLPNRALVLDRIEQMLLRDRRQHTTGAALFLDLDDFKNINDTLGHGAGDRLLVAVAARLAGALRGVDTIGRMGGDEFVILIESAALDVAPELVAERLIAVMSEPFELDDASTPLLVNVSIGIASGDRASPGDLLRDADLALYQAKAAGKNRYEVFDPQMQTSISRRTDLEFDLRSALAGGQFRLVYQPIYDLGDLTVVGVEALLRWDHPVRGVISPSEFVPILEQSGQINEVGRWVLQQACRQMAGWHAKGDRIDVSVNVSGRQLDHDSIVTDISAALRDSGLAPVSLIIEITETALMRNVEAAARRLRAVKALGVKIAVDDFGTGYSSLAYLRQFPVDCLKIDRMFTNAITASPQSQALISTLVKLGKDLGLTTLAEGVETTEEMDLLRGADVNHAQGFLMAQPLDPDTLEARFLVPTRSSTATIDLA
jgi:diguanylate cyclase (GGDEF)-like protein